MSIGTAIGPHASDLREPDNREGWVGNDLGRLCWMSVGESPGHGPKPGRGQTEKPGWDWDDDWCQQHEITHLTQTQKQTQTKTHKSRQTETQTQTQTHTPTHSRTHARCKYGTVDSITLTSVMMYMYAK